MRGKISRYLFGKVNYASLCLRIGEFAKIPIIFGHKFDLKELYPGRSTFHITEFVAFTGVIGLYFVAIGERGLAKRYYENLKKTAPDHHLTKALKERLYPGLLGKILERLERAE